MKIPTIAEEQKSFEKFLAACKGKPPRGQTWEQFVREAVAVEALLGFRVTVPDWARGEAKGA